MDCLTSSALYGIRDLPRGKAFRLVHKTSKEPTMFEVAYIVITAKGTLKTVVKSFKTAEARAKHVAKRKEKGDLYEVIGYRD